MVQSVILAKLIVKYVNRGATFLNFRNATFFTCQKHSSKSIDRLHPVKVSCKQLLMTNGVSIMVFLLSFPDYFGKSTVNNSFLFVKRLQKI